MVDTYVPKHVSQKKPLRLRIGVEDVLQPRVAPRSRRVAQRYEDSFIRLPIKEEQDPGRQIVDTGVVHGYQGRAEPNILTSLPGGRQTPGKSGDADIVTDKSPVGWLLSAVVEELSTAGHNVKSVAALPPGASKGVVPAILALFRTPVFRGSDCQNIGRGETGGAALEAWATPQDVDRLGQGPGRRHGPLFRTSSPCPREGAPERHAGASPRDGREPGLVRKPARSIKARDGARSFPKAWQSRESGAPRLRQ